ncbi:redoxin domain-containing protein [Actinomyces sp.]|uniref:TlpA family protein disulfide reductase n=1 Tax=Actinomyces sp. TaxID=29317 RepID=UPI0026DDB91B|nr:redoxin domain-containing protein [Actinomyces sp.]MDO4901743.1 redoxin domain-containing protein [Actinomyces sp.]
MRDETSDEPLEEISADLSDGPDVVEPATLGDGSDEPAWRAGVRGSRFGQVAVLIVAAFAIAIAAWWAVAPDDAGPAQAEIAVVTEVDVEGVGSAPVVGQKAPAITAADLDSREVVLEPDAMEGRPVWLMFVATWCTGCRTEMPDVQAAAADYEDDVEVIVVYVGEDAAAVNSYSERVGNEFTQVPDRSQVISAAYGIMGVPSHFFIGADGVVQQVHVGLLNPEQMNEALQSLTAS